MATTRLNAGNQIRQRLRAWRQSDDGAVSVELVIAVPALMLLLMLVVQFGIWAHANHVAGAAAAHALADARVQGGDAAAGRNRAAQLLTELGNQVVVDPTITVSREAGQASVEIRGTALAIVPFLELPVQARAVGSVEMFTSGG